MRRGLAVLFLVGCAPALPMHHPLPEPANVAASYDKTWAAVIDLFATGSIPIKTMEKASGLVVAEQLAVDLASSQRYADCGGGPFGALVAQRATYNVRVTGDSAASLVRVTALFANTVRQCTSLGVFEREMMAAITAAAQRQR
jgi:hypothetical protein